MSRATLLAVIVTVLLAAGGTVAYSLGGRRSPAAAHDPVPVAAAVALDGRVAPARVAYGGTVRLSGTIRDAAGAPLPGLTVEVLATRTDAPAEPVVVGRPRSDARGRVAASFRPAAGSTVWLWFGGAEGLAEATSDPVRVGVTPVLSVRASTTRRGGTWTTRFTGTVRPAQPGAVRLERRGAGGWTRVATARVTAKGAYAFTVTDTDAGTHGYRVVRAADGAYTRAVAARDVRLVAPPPPPVRGGGNGGPGSLLVTGDSFAYYLGQQLAGERKPRVTTVDSRHSTGLTRPDFFDWNAEARRQVRAKPGAVVVFLGANDCQPIRVGGTGAWATVGSTSWVKEYRRRAGVLMRTYGGGGARPVYWVGLPITKKPDINACYRAMNAATAAAAKDAGRVTWVDSWSVYAVDGRYSARVGGIVARQDDGIHFTFEGTRFLTRKVYAVLRP
jgi:lysophospholipase L1-like esterase